MFFIAFLFLLETVWLWLLTLLLLLLIDRTWAVLMLQFRVSRYEFYLWLGGGRAWWPKWSSRFWHIFLPAMQKNIVKHLKRSKVAWQIKSTSLLPKSLFSLYNINGNLVGFAEKCILSFIDLAEERSPASNSSRDLAKEGGFFQRSRSKRFQNSKLSVTPCDSEVFPVRSVEIFALLAPVCGFFLHFLRFSFTFSLLFSLFVFGLGCWDLLAIREIPPVCEWGVGSDCPWYRSQRACLSLV